MDKKQQDQLKKGLVFGGLGFLFALLLCGLSLSPSGKGENGSAAGTQ